MRTIFGFVGRAPLVTFTVLAYLLSWWPTLLPGGGLLPYGPTLAALVVIAAAEGKPGLRKWRDRMFRPGRGWKWYGQSATIPAALAFGAAGLTIAVVAHPPGEIEWTDPVVALPIMLVLGGLWEEPGWTGFALPRLAERFGSSPSGTIAATAIMVMIRAGWHLPLMITGVIPWWDMLLVVGFQAVVSWLFLGSGSVLPVMLMHLVSNTVGGAFVSTWFTGSDRTTEAALRAGLWTLLALGLALGTRARPTWSDRRTWAAGSAPSAT